MTADVLEKPRAAYPPGSTLGYEPDGLVWLGIDPGTVWTGFAVRYGPYALDGMTLRTPLGAAGDIDSCSTGVRRIADGADQLWERWTGSYADPVYDQLGAARPDALAVAVEGYVERHTKQIADDDVWGLIAVIRCLTEKKFPGATIVRPAQHADRHLRRNRRGWKWPGGPKQLFYPYEFCNGGWPAEWCVNEHDGNDMGHSRAAWVVAGEASRMRRETQEAA